MVGTSTPHKRCSMSSASWSRKATGHHAGTCTSFILIVIMIIDKLLIFARSRDCGVRFNSPQRPLGPWALEFFQRLGYLEHPLGLARRFIPWPHGPFEGGWPQDRKLRVFFKSAYDRVDQMGKLRHRCTSQCQVLCQTHAHSPLTRIYRKVFVDLVAPSELALPKMYEDRMVARGYVVRTSCSAVCVAHSAHGHTKTADLLPGSSHRLMTI